VGIDVGNPSSILTVLQGGGNAIADGWSTYSSRRWKTNIHPLENALSKVEQLRGVSYDLKDSGKHEIGVIAEEVGQVVPEVVSFEKNGKDGVDYSRLTALLIEAVKQQQKQITTQQRLIRKQQRLMTMQQKEIAGLSRKVGVLETSLGSSHRETASVLVSRAKTGSSTLP
jgi:Chaperone of endosialidase